MSSPSPAARPHPASAREAELTRAENELSTHEARLAEHLARAAAEAAALTERLSQTRAALERVQAEPDADPTLALRLDGAVVPGLDVEAPRQRALEARQAALEARRKAGQEMVAALKAYQEQVAQVARAVADAETVVKLQAETAAARTRAKQEAAARAQQEAARARQAEQARAARGTPAAPAPAVPPAMTPKGSRPSSESTDARRNGRVRMHTSIDMRSDSNFFTGFSMDISEGGVFIATVDPVPRGTQVELDFTLPGGRPMKVTGVVRWVRESNPRTPELMPGVGVQFTGLAPEVAHAISTFVTTRDPMFFPD